VVGVAFGEGTQRPARPDRTELAVVADDDQLRSRSLDGREESHDFDGRRALAFVEDDDVVV
jgi:hypothetical protein